MATYDFSSFMKLSFLSAAIFAAMALAQNSNPRPVSGANQNSVMVSKRLIAQVSKLEKLVQGISQCKEGSIAVVRNGKIKCGKMKLFMTSKVAAVPDWTPITGAKGDNSFCALNAHDQDAFEVLNDWQCIVEKQGDQWVYKAPVHPTKINCQFTCFTIDA